MKQDFLEPLGTGQRVRRKSRRRHVRERMRRVLRNRLTLMVVLWVARATVQLARLIGNLIDGS